MGTLCQGSLCCLIADPWGPMSLSSGYVAIGFSDSAGSMGPADAYAGWIDASGAAHVVDFSTSGHTVNAADTQQDGTVVAGALTNGVLTITFQRALNTQARPAPSSRPLCCQWEDRARACRQFA